MRDLYIETEATTEPVIIDEIKAYCDYLGSDPGVQSTLLNIAKAARLRLEQYTGRNFVEKTMVLIVDKVEYRFALPFAPINSLTSVLVYDEDNALDTTLVDGTDYHLIGDFHKYIRFESADNGEYYKITYKSGYKSSDKKLPDALKHAILAQTKYDFKNSSGGGDTGQIMLSNEARLLVQPYIEYEI